MTTSTKTNSISIIDLENMAEDLYTLATLWSESFDSKELDRCRYYIGNQMADKAKEFFKIYQAAYGEDAQPTAKAV